MKYFYLYSSQDGKYIGKTEMVDKERTVAVGETINNEKPINATTLEPPNNDCWFVSGKWVTVNPNLLREEKKELSQANFRNSSKGSDRKK